MDEDELCTEEEAEDALRQYQASNDASEYWKRIDSAWEELIAECDQKRKERRESA